MTYYLAIDIGASSGRDIVGWLENDEIKTDEVYRFPNGTETMNGHLVWDINWLFENVKKGIKSAFKKYPNIKSLAIDTWGVDYVLITNNGYLPPCLAYRDNRTEAVIEEAHALVPFEEMYKRTGIQFQPFNTVYQMFEDNKRGRLDVAADFLMIPEYLNYMLTGVKMHEYTNATTTGLVNAYTGEYDEEIIAELGLPARLFGKLYQPGTKVGNLKPKIAKAVCGQTEVVLCASHDTASAVEGLPIDDNSPYISSGTWSLLGLKMPKAVADENSLKANYSNEGGVGYIRYQKNIMGMWVVNRLRDELCPNKPFSRIVEEARQSAFNDYVDINGNAFLAPESMKEEFDKCFESCDLKPRQENDYFRCAFISLAQSYRTALDELRSNSGKDFDKLYIVGGGAKNSLLNELTEKVCNLKVNALPIEATAIGNLKIQIRRQ
ncbi:MAG: rhamnulokinase [Clostridiales bacterium]|nr:rhamnulokinase [Clostridiales bacterium]